MVNSNDTAENTEENNVLVENEENKDEKADDEKQTISTSASIDTYYEESRLTRDKMYSQMLESYQKILESPNVAEAQKQIASQEINNINNRKNAIMISENLIKNKGIEDVVIFINDKSISVIIREENLTEDQIAQIQNIITRELVSEIDNIHISTKN